MTDSGYLDFSSADLGQGRDPSEPRPRRSRLLTIVLLLVLVGVPLFAAWVHLGRVHATDLDAFAQLRAQFLLLDRNVPLLSHGQSPPCETSDDAGIVTRGYSPETGPTPAELRDQLQLLGYWPTTTSPGALFTMDQTVDDYRFVVDVMGATRDGRGTSVRGTSSATSLACLLR